MYVLYIISNLLPHTDIIVQVFLTICIFTAKKALKKLSNQKIFQMFMCGFLAWQLYLNIKIQCFEQFLNIPNSFRNIANFLKKVRIIFRCFCLAFRPDKYFYHFLLKKIFSVLQTDPKYSEQFSKYRNIPKKLIEMPRYEAYFLKAFQPDLVHFLGCFLRKFAISQKLLGIFQICLKH